MPVAQSARSPDKPWFTTEPGLPNDAEVLCYAFLVANIGWELDTIRQWADKVLSAQGVGCKLGQEWVTPDDPWWRARGEKTAAVYEPFHAAINGTIWEGDALDRIGAAMQRWQGAGRCDGPVSYTHLRAHET